MLRYKNAFYYFRIIADIFILFTINILTYFITQSSVVFRISSISILISISLVIVWIITSFGYGLYDEFRSRNFSFELIVVLKNIFVQSIIIIVILFILKKYELSR